MPKLSPGYRPDPRDLDRRLAELNHSPHAPALRLAAAAAATARGDATVTTAVFRRILQDGSAPVHVEEAVLQTYLFAGYPRAINALGLLASLHPAPEERKLDLEADLGRDRQWLARGRDLCRRVYGDRYERLLDHMARISPDLGRWMVQEGYGKVLSRPTLDAPTRELAAIGALVVLDVPDQLRAHLRGAGNVGAHPDAVAGAVEMGLLVAPEQSEPARALLRARRE